MFTALVSSSFAILNYEFLIHQIIHLAESLKNFHIPILFLPFLENVFNLFSIYF